MAYHELCVDLASADEGDTLLRRVAALEATVQHMGAQVAELAAQSARRATVQLLQAHTHTCITLHLKYNTCTHAHMQLFVGIVAWASV